jgi:hypothetical protein
MKVMNNFTNLKYDLLRRAVAARACSSGIIDLARANNFEALSVVMKEYFMWGCFHSVITADILLKYREEFRQYGIHINEDVVDGCVLVDGSNKVSARGNSRAYAYDNGIVLAYDGTFAWSVGDSNIQFLKNNK